MNLNKGRYVLLDRDGTLNAERHYLSDPDELELLPTVIDGLRELQASGVGLVVVTNQSAIGRGFISVERLDEIHARLEDLLADGGVTLDGIYACPHHPDDGCRCRKPQAGLVVAAASEHGFDPARSVVVGDSRCDIELGCRVGATTILVTTGYGRAVLEASEIQPDLVATTFLEAARLIVAGLA